MMEYILKGATDGLSGKQFGGREKLSVVAAASSTPLLLVDKVDPHPHQQRLIMSFQICIVCVLWELSDMQDE